MNTHRYTWVTITLLVHICIACQDQRNISETESIGGEFNSSDRVDPAEESSIEESVVLDDLMSGSESQNTEGEEPPAQLIALDLPMISKEEELAKFLLIPSEARRDSETQETYVLTYPLNMAVAEGYPTQFKVTLDAPLFASSCAQTDGDIEPKSVTETR